MYWQGLMLPVQVMIAAFPIFRRDMAILFLTINSLRDAYIYRGHHKYSYLDHGRVNDNMVVIVDIPVTVMRSKFGTTEYHTYWIIWT